MSGRQRLILLLLALAVLATFGALAWLVVGDLRGRHGPVPTRDAPTAIPPVEATATPAAPAPGAFTPPATRPAPASLEGAVSVDWLIAGDFDGNGKEDLATVDLAEGVLSIYAGDGRIWDGLLTERSELTRRLLSGRPTCHAAADLDGDGAMDLALGMAGATDERGVLLVWGGSPWSARQIVLPEAPLALLADGGTKHKGAYVLTPSGIRRIVIDAARQISLSPPFAAPAHAEGSTQPGAVWLTGADGNAYICFVAEHAGQPTLATLRGETPPVQGQIDFMDALTATPRALLPDPADDASFWLWEGERLRKATLAVSGDSASLIWGETAELAQPAQSLLPARLGPAQEAGVLALQRTRAAVTWYRLPLAALPPSEMTPAMPGAHILALTATDADGDGHADVTLAVRHARGVSLVTWTAADHAW